MAKNKNGNEEIEVLDFDIEDQTSEVQFEEYEREPKENIFKKLKNNWDDLEGKTKAIIIIVTVVILLIIIGALLYIKLVKNNSSKTNDHKEVVVAKDNYRYEDGVLYFVVNGKDIGSYECKNKDKNLCYVAYETKDDKFDVTQYKNEDKVRSKIIKNKFVFIFDNKDKKDEELILYNIKSKKNVGSYTAIKTYAKLDNIVFAKNDDEKYGVLDFSDGTSVSKIKFSYDYLGIITEDKNVNEEVIVASDNGAYSLIDYSGKEISKKINFAITNYNDKYIKSKDATGKYTLYDYNGEKIAEGLDYIDLLDEYYIAVDKDNKLLIYDYENTKYLEEGIELKNTNYVKTITKEGTTEKVEYAYVYVLNDNELTFKINDEGTDSEVKINLLEGKASKDMKFISYFNGSLYFYKDEKKETLINSYKCNNPNQLTKDNMKLDKCFLASDTNEDSNDINVTPSIASVVPIMNERYVFIKDNDIINLVDLIDEKVIGTYSSINTYGDATKNEPYILQTAEQYVFAKNKNGKYGLIRINQNGASGVYNFEYEKLEKMDKYIYAQKGKKYYLLDYNGNRVTFEYALPIRNYNGEYVKLLSKDKYYVYDFDGNIVFDKGYKYIELYDNFVALVDENNKLTVVDYAGNKIINDTIKLSSTIYYRPAEGLVPAFSITKKENELVITCATSQETKKENAKSFTFDLKTKKRIDK